MSTKVRGTLSGWLAALALVPVVGWGQVILEHPQTQTVCAGEVATFSSETDGGLSGWILNGTLHQRLPPEIERRTDVVVRITPNGTRIEELTIFYNAIFNGWEVRSVVSDFGSSSTSTAAYLFYETNPQFSVTGLTPTITNTTAQFEWNAHNSNLTTRFFFGVYDSNNNQISNQTTDATHISYDLSPTCQQLEFRLTAVEVQYPECPDVYEQTRYVAYFHTRPDIAPVTAEFNNQTVLVNWTPAEGSGAYWVSFAGLGFDAGDPPFSHTPARCGEHDLTFFVSPAECPDEPGFTHNASVSFTIPCPTTPTEPTTATEATGQPSGALASLPSLLSLAAAAVALLRCL